MRADVSKLNIRPTDESDLNDLVDLWNDGRVMRWVGFPDGLGYDRQKAVRWLANLASNPHRHHYVIRDTAFDFCGELYYEVDAIHHMASLDIKLVPNAQGRGIATQALRVLIDLIFRSETEVDSVWVEPWPDNLAAHRLYTRCDLKPQPRPLHLGEGPSYWELKREDWTYA
jgi:RimJ/RimL family protein N-acetyltransferase